MGKRARRKASYRYLMLRNFDLHERFLRMNLFDACRSCKICGRALKRERCNTLIMGCLSAEILLIGSSNDWVTWYDDASAYYIPNNAALTFTIRCPMAFDRITEKEIDNCSVYTRLMTFAFNQFYLCEEAWNQLKLGDSFELGKIMLTPIGLVFCVESIIPWISFSDPHSTIPLLHLDTGYRGVELKPVRKQILFDGESTK